MLKYIQHQGIFAPLELMMLLCTLYSGLSLIFFLSLSSQICSSINNAGVSMAGTLLCCSTLNMVVNQFCSATCKLPCTSQCQLPRLPSSRDCHQTAVLKRTDNAEYEWKVSQHENDVTVDLIHIFKELNFVYLGRVVSSRTQGCRRMCGLEVLDRSLCLRLKDSSK